MGTRRFAPSDTAPPWADLPDAVLERVFLSLLAFHRGTIPSYNRGPVDRLPYACARQVCRSWARVGAGALNRLELFYRTRPCPRCPDDLDKRFPCLERLALLGRVRLGGYDHCGLAVRQLAACSSLTDLTISAGVLPICETGPKRLFDAIPGLPRSLTTLVCEGKPGFVASGLHHLLPLTSLRELRLSLAGGLIPDSMDVIAQLTSLKTLALESVDRELGDESLLKLRALTGLTTLTLGGCSTLTNKGVHGLRHLTMLDSLELVGVGRVDGALLQGFKFLTGLTHLSLSQVSCPWDVAVQEDERQIEAASLANLEPLTRLTSLDLSVFGFADTREVCEVLQGRFSHLARVQLWNSWVFDGAGFQCLTFLPSEQDCHYGTFTLQRLLALPCFLYLRTLDLTDARVRLHDMIPHLSNGQANKSHIISAVSTLLGLKTLKLWARYRIEGFIWLNLINDNDIVQLLSGLVSLEELQLSDAVNITTAALLRALRPLDELKQLHVFDPDTHHRLLMAHICQESSRESDWTLSPTGELKRLDREIYSVDLDALRQGLPDTVEVISHTSTAPPRLSWWSPFQPLVS